MQFCRKKLRIRLLELVKRPAEFVRRSIGSVLHMVAPSVRLVERAGTAVPYVT
ncbi:hypothetical protein CA51_35930 [Rosistilla oblonga]|nr:hypothetical protein CA51_35930 [Rosistilla oblonga]